jgi:hypothetical protein
MTGVAIVIPMLNEAAGLPRVLRSLTALEPPPAPRILPCRRVAVCRLSGRSSAAAAAQNGSYSDWS